MTPDHAAASRPSFKAARDAQRALRLVVADDDLDTVLTLMMVLRDEGYDVRGVSSPADALSAINEFNPDAVLLDIGMPGLSGWELARRIRERLARRPMLIAISGQYKDGADKILAQIVGFDHYLVKPYDTAALLRLLAPLRLPPLRAALGEERL
jgi:two-component system OmpR family response regulator